MEGVINDKEAELTKMKEMMPKLKETGPNKPELQKKHEEILLQSNVGFLSTYVCHFLPSNYHTCMYRNLHLLVRDFLYPFSQHLICFL